MKQVEQYQFSIRGSRVLYLGEGNANLVVAIRNKRVVLRFAKSKFSEKCQEEKLAEIATFVNWVMLPRLGDSFIHPVAVVELPHHELQWLKSEIQRFRPPLRCNKDIFYPKALLLPDHTLLPAGLTLYTTGPTLAIELKPKMGHCLSGETRSRHHPTTALCNFCLKQFYKYQQGLTSNLSNYCPLDLYSGQMARMEAAVQALLQCPQNNLRLFGDGELLHGEDTTLTQGCKKFLDEMFGCESSLCDIILTALLAADMTTTAQRGAGEPPRRRAANCEGAGALGGICASFVPRLRCDKSYQGLPRGSILAAILDIQTSNVLTDEQALEILERLLQSGNTIENLQGLLTAPEDSRHCPLSEELVMLRNYLLAATAKDLSIFLTVRREHNGRNCSTARTGGGVVRLQLDETAAVAYCVSIRLIDLDPKHVHKISKYVSKKAEWLEALQYWK